MNEKLQKLKQIPVGVLIRIAMSFIGATGLLVASVLIFIDLTAAIIIGLISYWISKSNMEYVAGYNFPGAAAEDQASGYGTDNRSNAALIFRYRNSKGEVSERKVVDFTVSPSWIHGYCLLRGEERTFKRERIVELLSDLNLDELVTVLDEKIEEEFMGMFGPVEKQHPPGSEIAFTGFAREEKERLIALARRNGYIVHPKVTKFLDYLCTGPNAGPRKMERAQQAGAVFVSREEFLAMVNGQK